MPPKHPQFAAFFAARRAELGLSMEDIAKHVGIAKSNLYNYEHGDVLPKAGKMQALAAALDVSYEDLLAVAGVARPEGLPTITPYLRAKYRDLPDEAVAEAEQFFAELQQRYGGGGNAESDR